jgi:hypothetical protein
MDFSGYRGLLIAVCIVIVAVSTLQGGVARQDFPTAGNNLQQHPTDRGFPDIRKIFHLEGASPGIGFSSFQDRLDTIFVQTEVLDQEWDRTNELWQTTMDVKSTYDAQGRMIETTADSCMNFSGGGGGGGGHVCSPVYLAQLTYDANGWLVRVITKIWNGAIWQTYLRDTVMYNTGGYPVEQRIDMYNGSSWIGFQKYTVSYDGSNRPVELIGQGWSGAAWVNSTRDSMAYDGSGRRSDLVKQLWVASAWMNNLRETYGYNVAGQRTEELNQMWYGGVWNNDTRQGWVFDDNNFLVQDSTQDWQASAWVNNVLNTYINDVDGLAGEIHKQYWDGFVWADDKIMYITFDGANPVEELTQSWTGITWVNFHLRAYSWQQVITSLEVTQQIGMVDKWNMVSVPLDVANFAKDAVFPTSVGNAFSFDGGYSASPTLEVGKGYWLKFSGAQDVSVTGVPVTQDTVDVAAGWNLVGSLSVAIPSANVASIPGGLVSSNFFRFDGGYGASTTLDPGKGYWVKLTGAGKLILSSAGNTPVAARLRMELSGEMPPPPPGEASGTAVPAQFSLDQNYPNPFNPATTIRYTLPEAGYVRIAVFNTLGQQVAVIADGRQDAGEKTASFDAGALPGGVYVYRLLAGTHSASGKMVLLK